MSQGLWRAQNSPMSRGTSGLFGNIRHSGPLLKDSGLATHQYFVIRDVSKEPRTCQFTLLDTMVAKDLCLLYERGLTGRMDDARRDRLRGFLLTKDLYGEMFAGWAALENAWDGRSGTVDVHRFRKTLAVSAAVSRLDGIGLRRVLSGVPVRQVVAADPREFEEADDGLLACAMPTLLPTYCILREAWRLADAGDWAAGLAALERLLNDTLQHASGAAVVVASVLLAGSTNDAGVLRGLLKYGSAGDKGSAEKVRGAMWDLFLLGEVDGLVVMNRTLGEPSAAVCLLTVDTKLVGMNDLVTRHYTQSAAHGFSWRVPTERFYHPDRHERLSDFHLRVNSSIWARANKQVDTYQSIAGRVQRALAYLDSIGDRTWHAAGERFLTEWSALNEVPETEQVADPL